MELKLNATVNGNELTVLTGKALEQKYPEKINLVGNIHSVANFLEKRNENSNGIELQEVDKRKAVVLVDESKFEVSLFLDPQNPFGTEIHAKLELTPELTQFQINGTKQYSREELVKLLRFNRRFVTGDFQSLLLAYQKLQLNTVTNLKQESDTRGNKLANFEKSVDSSTIPNEFVLNIPVFKGFPSLTFRVEICFDTTDQSVRFWFESVELDEIIKVRSKEIIDAQLEYCKDFVIIHK